ncbi:MAG TPA: sulfotransferase [Caulobacteraceae bacterium]
MAGAEETIATARAANALRRAGRMDEAIALLRAETARAPRDPAAWANLADCLAAANRPDLALAAWERVLTLAPRSVPALVGKGRALQALARPAEAAGAFEAALAAAPEAGEARFSLAMLAFDAGSLDSAAAHAARLPDTPAAKWLAARIAAARGEFERARDILQAMAPGLADAPRADALMLLGSVLDRLGEPSRAFRAALDGKAIQHRLFAPRAAGREGETAKLKRLAAWFETADPAPWATAPDPYTDEANGHVFLVGFPRSGTTLLEQALAGHSDIVALEEAPTLADAYQEFLTGPDGLSRLARIDPSEADRWRGRYWQVVRQHGVDPAGRLFLDKAPAGTLNLPLVAKLFPRAKILFAIRDPRDVVLSCAMNAFQMNALTYAFTSVAETAACYDAAMTLARVYRHVLPLTVKDVRYETLVEDFAGELAAISAFLGIAFSPTMTDIAGTTRGRVVRTPSSADVRGGLNRRGLARWRDYAAELAPVTDALRPWIEAFGYPAA